MVGFRLTPSAEADLKDIARYTQRKWGQKQRNHYLSVLDSRFTWLAEEPLFGKSRDEIKAGYRSYPEGQHIIFYRVVKENIEILGILHQNMDLKQHL